MLSTPKRISSCWLSALLMIICFSTSAHPTAKANKPFKIRPTYDRYILGAGTVIFATSYFLFPSPGAYTQAEISVLHPSGFDAFEKRATRHWSPEKNRIAELTAVLTATSMATLVFSEAARDQALVIGIMTTEMLIWSAALPQLAKVSVKRNRPFAYNPEADLEARMSSRARQSFFSRTSTMAFASGVFSAVLFDAYYPDSPYSPWVWAGTLAMATSAATLKYYSGQHFPTDILTGAALGALIGWYIPRLHTNTKGENVSLTISPVSMGWAFSATFSF